MAVAYSGESRFIGMPAGGIPMQEQPLEFVPPWQAALESAIWQKWGRDAVRHGLPTMFLKDGVTPRNRVIDRPVPASSFPNLREVDFIFKGCNRNCWFCSESHEYVNDISDQPDMDAYNGMLNWVTAPGSLVQGVNEFGGEIGTIESIGSMIINAGSRMRADGSGYLSVSAVTNGGEGFRHRVLGNPLARDKLTWVSVSREALDAGLNDALRGDGATHDFDLATDDLSRLRRSDESLIRRGVNMVVMRLNMDEVPGMIRMAYDRGYNRVNLHGLSDLRHRGRNLRRHVLNAREWNGRVLPAVIETVNRLAPRPDFVVDVEYMYADPAIAALVGKTILNHCAIQDGSNLAIEQPVIHGGKLWTGSGCTLYFESRLSEFIFDGKNMWRRAGRSALTDTVDCSVVCPARNDAGSPDVPICIHSRQHSDQQRLGWLSFTPGVNIAA